MRKIEPIQYTNNSELATNLECSSRNDRGYSCDIVWQLTTENGEYVDDGVLECSGDDYSAFIADNNYAYTFIANNLYKKLTLL